MGTVNNKRMDSNNMAYGKLSYTGLGNQIFINSPWCLC